MSKRLTKAQIAENLMIRANHALLESELEKEIKLWRKGTPERIEIDGIYYNPETGEVAVITKEVSGE